MKEKIKELYKRYKTSKKSSARVYLVLGILILGCIIEQSIRGHFHGAFFCFIYLILLVFPMMIQRRFNIELPNILEIIIICFIFSATVLGEIYSFYLNIPHWDTVLHTINGFICAGIGFALVELANENSKGIKLAPIYVAIVAFCFSMMIGACWEILEYGYDKVSHNDAQKGTVVQSIYTTVLEPEKLIIKDIAKTVVYDTNGNELLTINGGYLDMGINDTMKDLFVNLVGAVIFSALGYFHIKNRDKFKFTKNFMPKKRSKIE